MFSRAYQGHTVESKIHKPLLPISSVTLLPYHSESPPSAQACTQQQLLRKIHVLSTSLLGYAVLRPHGGAADVDVIV